QRAVQDAVGDRRGELLGQGRGKRRVVGPHRCGLHTKWVPTPKKHATPPDCIQRVGAILPKWPESRAFCAPNHWHNACCPTLGCHGQHQRQQEKGANMVQRFKLGRRALLGSAAGAAAVGLTGQALAQKPLVIGFIYVGPRDDYGYNQAHAEAAAILKKMAGLKVVEEEKVPETVAVEKSMESMINLDGATLLFPTSFGYFDPHM